MTTPPTPPATVGDRLAGFAPPVTPPVFTTAEVAYAVSDTPIGRILLACNDSGALVASAFVADGVVEEGFVERLGRVVSPRVLRLPGALDEPRRQLDDFLAGRRRGFDLPLALALTTPFQQTVLTTLAARVPYGSRSTYGALAAAIERPSAARAVGTALGANPLCVVLPCHRVLGASGALTGYAGGVAAKRYLLDLEAAHTAG